ncbi:13294_t:CDS:1, partial [Dentiscutata heterogama]
MGILPKELFEITPNLVIPGNTKSDPTVQYYSLTAHNNYGQMSGINYDITAHNNYGNFNVDPN